MRERFVSGEMAKEDAIESSLRPKTLNEFVGQTKLKQNLKVFIEAAIKRKMPIDHILLYGPPGLGKTTLAGIIANEMAAQIMITSGPAIERAADLAAIITALNQGDVIFIDEIHRLNKTVEEILYPAMEDFALDIVLGKGPGARSIHMPLPQWTLIGATTQVGNLTSPLRDRFGMILRLEPYKPQELCQIVLRTASILKVEITPQAAHLIAMRSRGTPRIANRLTKRIRDFALVESDGRIDEAITEYSFERLEVDGLGFDDFDRKLLLTMIKKFGGGPVGLDTLAAAVNEDATTIEDAIEPYLLQLGFISRTARGRVCMPAAYKHLGIALPRSMEQQLSFLGEEEGSEKE